MPELPEVECLTRAVRESLLGYTLVKADFRRKDLRSPIPTKRFRELLLDRPVSKIWRRSKYMIWENDEGGAGIFHLGMSGNMRLFDSAEPRYPHTHAVFSLRRRSEHCYLHYIDPRRFGRIDCAEHLDIAGHSYFKDLGPEPLDIKDLGSHLFERSRNRKAPVKSFLMDARTVVGVGNIYASESLFKSGIHPLREAGSISKARYTSLAAHVRTTLKWAIKCGGTTLKDFKSTDGQPGYFRIKLDVYDRGAEACKVCKRGSIEVVKISGRSSFYCPRCQT